MTTERAGVRFVAVVLALALSTRQAQFFDCNTMATLSVLGGAITLLLVYGAGEALYGVLTSPKSSQEKLKAGSSVLLVGGILVIGAGLFTMMTHLCP